MEKNMIRLACTSWKKTGGDKNSNNFFAITATTHLLPPYQYFVITVAHPLTCDKKKKWQRWSQHCNNANGTLSDHWVFHFCPTIELSWRLGECSSPAMAVPSPDQPSLWESARFSVGLRLWSGIEIPYSHSTDRAITTQLAWCYRLAMLWSYGRDSRMMSWRTIL